MKNLINLLRNMQEDQELAEFETTVHRSTEKRKAKEYMGICTYCGYHKNENFEGKYYDLDRRPSWKLATKNKKQWMSKPKSYKIVEKQGYRGNSYYVVEF